MADTNWQDFPDTTYIDPADIFLALRGAGGVNIPAAAFITRAAAGYYYAGSYAAGPTQLRLLSANSSELQLKEAADQYGFTLQNVAGSRFRVLRHNNDVGGVECLSIPRDSGNLGVGTPSPLDRLHIFGGSMRIESSAYPKVLYNSSGNGGDLKRWQTYVDPAGNFKIARLNDAENNEPSTFIFKSNGYLGVGAFSGDPVAPIDVTTGAGRLFITSASTAHSLHCVNNANSAHVPLRLAASEVTHNGDNAAYFGSAALRWAAIFAANGTIQTSDERNKQDVGAIPDEWLDAWGELEWVRFKFKDAVDAKGDDARWHVGLIAQHVQQAFADHGLDAQAIGLLCYNEWEEEREPITEERQVGSVTVVIGRVGTGVLGPDGAEIMREITEEQPIMAVVDTGETRATLEAGDRWGLRYDECQAMEAAWQRRELARKDAMIVDLSNRLAALEAA